jgi:hypothetical protein
MWGQTVSHFYLKLMHAYCIIWGLYDEPCNACIKRTTYVGADSSVQQQCPAHCSVVMLRFEFKPSLA